METYLIQRGITENDESAKDIDSIINFEYMGSAEYEFGALPDSLKEIRSDIGKYKYINVIVKGKYITVFCKEKQESEIKPYLDQLANNNMRLKARSCFNECVNPSTHDLKWQEIHPIKTNFWWDLENHLMFWINNSEFESKFKTLIANKPS